MKRIVVPAFVLLLMATACYPPLPPERDRFLGIRTADHHRRPVVMFGRERGRHAGPTPVRGSP